MLPAAEIIDGKLTLKIGLWEGSQLNLSSQGIFSLSEEGSPVSVSYSGTAEIRIKPSDVQIMWGIISHIETVNPDSEQVGEDATLRQKFTWNDGKLVILHEKVIYADRYFSSKILADRYADETGYPDGQVQAIPLQNCQIRVLNGKNEQHYFQLPVRITGEFPIKLESTGFTYPGSILIEAADDKLQVSNLVGLENYVAGVVPNEIGDNAPEAAIQAQAVAARTHALSLLLTNRHTNDGYDLCTGTHCQVYKGLYLTTDEMFQSVLETNGHIMLHNGNIADAVYHSSCGGKTEPNQNVWKGNPIPFLQGVACYSELDSLDLSVEKNAREWIDKPIQGNGMSDWEKSSEKWERTVSLKKIELDCNVTNLKSIIVLKRGDSGRIIKLLLHGDKDVTLEGEWNIRKAFGNLPSSFFYIISGIKAGSDAYKLHQSVKIKGKGFGHGVGLCQVGALRKARQGWSWEDILNHYYPGTLLNKNWNRVKSEDFEALDRSTQ